MLNSEAQTNKNNFSRVEWDTWCMYYLNASTNQANISANMKYNI